MRFRVWGFVWTFRNSVEANKSRGLFRAHKGRKHKPFDMGYHHPNLLMCFSGARDLGLTRFRAEIIV